MEIQTLLDTLFDNHALSQQQSYTLFTAVVQGKLSGEQLAAALIAIKLRGETTAELAGAVDALQQDARPFPRPDYDFADIVGTGGDGANTINISTASAIVAAILGAKIAKHGNRSVSSKTGSSDVLTALGVNIQVSAETARRALDEIGVCFLFAQQYHLGFKHAMPVRNALKTRTIFNILGPLINPAKPNRQLLGVYTPELIKPYAETALMLGHRHSFVVHGAGLDEVALHGKTDIAEIRDGKIEYYSVSPYDFGFEPQSLDVLRGGEPADNARMISALLQGKGDQYHAQAVAMNTALLLKLFGRDDLKHNAEQVLDTLANGSAFETLQRLTQYQD
ncbi:anthranilate phosphoribosyltransferase [Chelonobacter oris]|uniref:anthranilate phosphoribosyltransferase n=1 Tax=Chelonobacter oris TaxID=505317 RepID=UPI00244ACBDE|nr:anthranilate phosphoribosyltransferase [Chelonobacter oris]MDH3000114.1 anthranilate phosphoribosyltransferase [Chelonobacter oris]